MKVLFLDIDGVCNCQSTLEHHGSFIGIDPVMAERARRIVVEAQCHVVLSSTWRLHANSRKEVVEKVCAFIDTTPSLPTGFRGDEVKWWLERHPEVERYAILDDDEDFWKDQPLFRTTWAAGLTDEIADQVIDYLNAKVPA